MGNLRLMPTIVVKYVLRGFYSLFSLLFKVDPYKVTFASYRSDQIKDNLAFINKELLEKYPMYKRHFVFKKFDSSAVGKVTYIFHMIHACFHMATSRYFIVDDYYFPIYVIKPRKEVDIIQLWHSAGALKKFGFSTVGKSFGPSKEYLKHVSIHSNYTKVFVSSSEIIPYFSEAFNMPKEQIHPLGVPRTDYFFAEDMIEELRSRLYETYPDLANKKILLYAPTFRGKSHYQDQFELPFDIEEMEGSLGDDYALLIHLHPYMQKALEVSGEGFAYHIKDAFVIQELLAVSDILITDYSTVFFDYSLLNRPMIFYPYDLEDYKRSRDFYYTYEDIIPGPMAMDTATLIELIKEGLYNVDQISHFRDRFFDIQDGKATERIVENIFG
ncbi:CDP-glycerol glycerophosphotransferase family protein [Lederbergia lenta]|uniref:Ribitolphosphotransferase n=1 Tax=Lederbergia lenta TaxID=1467 RepID=A0A2X4WIC1_LEDLE|nr:CDP-glycerol glycerophosphotransferase family protein [Lederbergia lenta]MCM3111999.1 CDP-glycerol glycerophosphotransferase family protein [Lederbergia lenta]MEC2323171.1 CDP-glycerol glycerophosphotransferase family protein [Lederbergia lenta]SQI62881.1 ribitolphosphotransferase [Lederbergia lenta]